ncbi:AAA family ATPase [Bradyrhizobium liaoningense]|uniref:AAA family ATPase n=1 Tax=Bradyrhizobium liaoningense TaxID=43992 RepID=UPI001BACEFBB|nr:AAA family ATPase [Bradyrhizobium liaoningense]MBR0737021.1 AAA family ATPase [Bradyrhizobium liaoningense]
MKKSASRRTAKKPGLRKPARSYRMVPKRLVDLRAAPRHAFLRGVVDAKSRMILSTMAPAEDPEIEADDRHDEGSPHKPAKRSRHSAMTALIGAAFEASVSKEVFRKLEHNQALAVIVVVPSPAWVGPMKDYFRSAFGGRWLIMTRDGKSRTQNSDVGSDEVSRDLARGLCVAGVSADATLLPRALLSTVDITIRVGVPRPAVLATAIARFAKRSPKGLPPGLGIGLDLHDMVACFRPGSGQAKIVQRLQTATLASRGETVEDRLPSLKDAVEYGEARILGLQLARDIAAFREGRAKWSDLQKGICLVSEPGCGKSLYARILARECGVPIVVTNVADWFKNSGYLDDVLRSMRSVFDRCAALANPCAIAFLDEIDAVPNRDDFTSSNSGSRNKDYWLPLITDLLLRLDNSMGSSSTGSPRHGVIVVAATNNPHGVDPALLRPGRLEKMVRLERADAAGVENMLRFHVAGDVPDRNLPDIAAMMERSTGAEIMALVREARRIARHAGRPLAAGDLRAALLTAEKIPLRTDWRICLHEAGHAVTALAMRYGRVSHCVVGARTGSANRTLVQADENDLPTRRTIEDRATMFLGGRAAERVLLATGESIGGGGDEGSDIGLATEAIASLHLTWGVGGTVAFLGSRKDALEAVRYDRSLREVVEADLQRLQQRADKIVDMYRDAVIAVAKALQRRRHLSGDAVRAIFSAHQPVRSKRTPQVQ